jgi:hypothetical protein
VLARRDRSRLEPITCPTQVWAAAALNGSPLRFQPLPADFLSSHVRVEQQLVRWFLEPATRVQIPPRILIGPGGATSSSRSTAAFTHQRSPPDACERVRALVALGSTFLSVSSSSRTSVFQAEQRGCNSRHGLQRAEGHGYRISSEFADAQSISIPWPSLARVSQLVQGTAAVHIRGRDGSIPSAATTVGTTSPERRAAA